MAMDKPVSQDLMSLGFSPQGGRFSGACTYCHVHADVRMHENLWQSLDRSLSPAMVKDVYSRLEALNLEMVRHAGPRPSWRRFRQEGHEATHRMEKDFFRRASQHRPREPEPISSNSEDTDDEMPELIFLPSGDPRRWTAAG